MRKMGALVWIVLFSLMLTACSQDQDNDREVIKRSNEVEDLPDQEDLVSEEELVAEDARVITVNGDTIYGEQYNIIYHETKSYMVNNDYDVDDLEFVHEQTIQSLVNRTVLTQDASEKGITVTQEEVEAAYEETKAQFDTEESFKAVLAQLPYTEESFKEVLRQSLIQQYYINQEFSDIEVKAEDVELFYELLREQMDQAPALEDARNEIEQQMLENEIQLALDERLESLHEAAEIEEHLSHFKD
nr:SurA N-terminal domain-containing protein [Amphibacillus cookii]